MSGRLRTTLLLAAFALLSPFVAACGESDPVAEPDDPVLADGQQIYNRQCATCHGVAGGGGQAPRLAGQMQDRFPDIEDQIAIVTQGVSGTNMPAFEDRLDDDEIEAVVRYTREVL